MSEQNTPTLSDNDRVRIECDAAEAYGDFEYNNYMDLRTAYENGAIAEFKRIQPEIENAKKSGEALAKMFQDLIRAYNSDSLYPCFEKWIRAFKEVAEENLNTPNQ